MIAAAMTQSIAWATDANVLAAMLDATLSVWLCPNCVHYSDRKVIRKTRIDKENRCARQSNVFISIDVFVNLHDMKFHFLPTTVH